MSTDIYSRAIRHYQTPGMYYETSVARKVQPAFHTGIPVFVGFAHLTMAEQKTSAIRGINRWQQFEHLYETLPNHYLRYAVRGFFENGGQYCVVAPVHGDPDNPIGMAEVLITLFNKGGKLDDLENIDLVCVPDAMVESIKRTGRSVVIEIQSAVLEHCRRMGDRFAILDGFSYRDENGDPEKIQNLPAFAISHWQDLPPEHGALYYPWVSVDVGTSADMLRAEMPCNDVDSGDKVTDINSRLAPEANPYLHCFVPPCGHIAGIYSRTDLRTGVHKAPANEVLEGVLQLEADLSDDGQAKLYDANVNWLRSFRGRGIRVWGARTLSGQKHWSYINVRRLFLTLTRWVRQNLNEVAFEPNNQLLWDRVVWRLSAYCSDLFNKGALAGNIPAEAFFVKCDAETNPPENRETGRVIAHVGLAPAVPAEFIIVRITQSASTIDVTGLNIP